MANITINELRTACTATKNIVGSGDTDITSSDVSATGILDVEPSSVTVLKSDGSPLSVIWKYDAANNKVVITNLSPTTYNNCKVIIGVL